MSDTRTLWLPGDPVTSSVEAWAVEDILGPPERLPVDPWAGKIATRAPTP